MIRTVTSYADSRTAAGGAPGHCDAGFSEVSTGAPTSTDPELSNVALIRFRYAVQRASMCGGAWLCTSSSQGKSGYIENALHHGTGMTKSFARIGTHNAELKPAALQTDGLQSDVMSCPGERTRAPAHLPIARAKRVLTAVSNGRMLRCAWARRSPPWRVASSVVARSSGPRSSGSFPSA